MAHCNCGGVDSWTCPVNSKKYATLAMYSHRLQGDIGLYLNFQPLALSRKNMLTEFHLHFRSSPAVGAEKQIRTLIFMQIGGKSRACLWKIRICVTRDRRSQAQRSGQYLTAYR